MAKKSKSVVKAKAFKNGLGVTKYKVGGAVLNKYELAAKKAGKVGWIDCD